jgi:hypothetical protein
LLHPALGANAKNVGDHVGVPSLGEHGDAHQALPAVNVRTERDPNTSAPATYTGVYISDLFEAFGADKSTDVIGANCSDGRKQYYDRDYVAKHRPILLLKFDGKRPVDWPNSEHGSWLGPSHA